MKRFPRYLLVSFIIAIIAYFLGDGGSIVPCIVLGLFLGLFSVVFDTKEEKKAKAEERERRERQRKAEEAAKNAPGCHSMDGVDIMTFSSQNNLLTAGNNWLNFRIRNRNAYGVIVTVRYKYSYGWEKATQSFEVEGNRIRNIRASGEAWHKATDITIVQVH